MVSNVFINGLQLNTGNVKCLINDYTINKSFNNAKYPRYRNPKPSLFPVSAESDEYSFTLTLFCRGDFYEDLLDKEKAIYDEVESQISVHRTVKFYSDITPTWFDETGGVALVLNTAKYPRRGTDGKSYITLTFNATLHSLISETFPFNDTLGIAGNAIADFSIGSG